MDIKGTPDVLVNQSSIPARDAERTSLRHWSRETDASLWAGGAKYDSTFVIGLKTPGSARGFYHGKTLIDRLNRQMATDGLRSRGVRILWEDSTRLPVVEVRLQDVTMLHEVRKLPFIDYIEPAKVEIHFFSGLSGCDAEPLTKPIVTVMASNGGFDTLSQVMPWMGIPTAWKYTTGDGATIGFTDTGIDHAFDSPMGDGHFATVDSQGRPSLVQYRDGFEPDTIPACDHGTRSANIAAAPRDGRGVVGVAYRARVISDAFHNIAWVWDESNATSAIYAVWYLGANVISMPWGMPTWSSQISDMIDNLYYGYNTVFVGAAGTCYSGTDDCPGMGSAVFPAEKGEVLATTGSNWDGSKPISNYDWGSKIEGVLSYTRIATAGFGPSSPEELNGSSAATAVVTGVAALVRSRYPTMNNHDLYMRIVNTSGDRCANAPPQWRNNMINTVASVGGPCLPFISGPAYVNLYRPAQYVTANYSIGAATGDNSGQYSYSWTANGGTSGRTATQTFWANSTWTSYVDYAQVTVTDPVTGVSVTRSMPVSVNIIPCAPHRVC
jgi:hypothetical protein